MMPMSHHYVSSRSGACSLTFPKRLQPPVSTYAVPILVSFLVLSCAIFRQEYLLDRTGTQWAPYLEWGLKNATYSGNPYDLIATVTFAHTASDETRITEMFYDGGDIWKFRFTGTRTGEWVFTTSSSDRDLHGYTGTVMINRNRNPGAHGFLTKFGNKWGWQGTDEALVPQLVMYKDPNKYYDRPDMIDADIQTFLGEHGFNGFHTRVYNRWFHIEDERTDASPVANPDPRTFEALELLITKTHAAGGLVHIWMWSKGQIDRRAEKRIQRYIAARLGPIPGWSVGYGYDLNHWVTADQLHEWRDYFHHYFGWPHFVGGRAGGPNNGTDHAPYIAWNLPLDFSSYEHNRPSYEVYVAAIDAVPAQPAFSEDRFRIRLGSPYGNKDYTMELIRRGLWHSTLAGGVANIWGNVVDPNTGKNAYLNGPSFPYPAAALIKTYAEFFKQRFLQAMVRDNEITDGVCLRHPARTHYVFYKENTKSIHMNLSKMNDVQPAVAVDTKKPYAELILGDLRREDQTWSAPYQSDWAIAVGDFEKPASSPPILSSSKPSTNGYRPRSQTITGRVTSVRRTDRQI